MLLGKRDISAPFQRHLSADSSPDLRQSEEDQSKNVRFSDKIQRPGLEKERKFCLEQTLQGGWEATPPDALHTRRQEKSFVQAPESTWRFPANQAEAFLLSSSKCWAAFSERHKASFSEQTWALGGCWGLLHPHVLGAEHCCGSGLGAAGFHESSGSLSVTASLPDTQQKVNHRVAEYFKLEGSLSPPPGSSCTLCVRVVSRCSLSPIQPAEPVPHLLYMEGSLSTTF